MALLPDVRFTLVIGRYAQDYRLGKNIKAILTETVKSWKDYTPVNLPLPHPSPRNNRWLKNNAWFLQDVVPYLKRRVRKLIK